MTVVNDLIANLECLGFARDPSTGWFDRDDVRVVIGDGVAVYRFTHDAARLLVWEAISPTCLPALSRLPSPPLSVTTALPPRRRLLFPTTYRRRPDTEASRTLDALAP